MRQTPSPLTRILVSHEFAACNNLESYEGVGAETDLQGDVGNGNVDGVEEGEPEEDDVFPRAEFAEVEVASP